MRELLIWVLAALLVNAAAFGLTAVRSGKNGSFLRRAALRFAAAGTAEVLLLAALTLLVRLFGTTGEAAPFRLFPALLLAACGTLLASGLGRAGRPASCRRICGALCLAAYGLEIFLFNGGGFLPVLRRLSPAALSLEAAELEGDVRLEDGALLFGTGGGSVTWNDLDIPAAFVQFGTGGQPYLREASIQIKDSGQADSFAVSRTARFVSGEAAHAFSIAPYGRLQGLRLCFTGSGTSFRLVSVSLNEANAFSFSALRFCLLAGSACLLLLILRLRLWKIWYEEKKPIHRLAAAAAVLTALLPCVLLGSLHTQTIPYPLENPVSTYSAHVQQFDAFQKGRLSLDLEADPHLAAMENPYDFSARQEQGISYYWDRAYYGGAYYSYFGVVPVLLVYYPFYWLTGSLPTEGAVCGLFACFTAFFLCLLLLELLRLFGRRVNLLLLLLGLPAAVAAGTIYGQQGYADMYYIPVAAGCCFLMAALYLTLRACRMGPGIARLLLLAGAGTSFALILGSRPNLVLYGAAALPLLLGLWFRRTEPIRRRAAAAACFLIPALLITSGLFWYNAARFGSPFDFGVSHQLTVSDPAANTLRLSNLFPAFYHYLFQPFEYDAAFPFLRPSFRNLGIYGRPVYLSYMVGVLAFPAVGAGLAALPMAFSRRTIPAGKNTACARAVGWLLVIPALALAFLDFSLAGVNLRYLSDLMPVLAVVGIAALLLVHRRAAHSPSLRGPAFAASAALIISSYICGLSLAFYDTFSVWSSRPWVFTNLERLVLFWL